MGKALLVFADTGAAASGEELNFFGAAPNGTEASTQYAATQDCTFSALGYLITSGGSGTNTLQFRDAGANGQQVATRAGPGAAADTTHTDVLSAADLFNVAHTDDGTSPVYRWVKCNVEFAVGHGNFHGSANYDGSIHDVPSATRFKCLSGLIGTDGVITEANVAWKTRAYDTFAALQVRVSANARINDTLIKGRINGGDATGTITFGAGETGLKQITGLGSITDGQTVAASIAMDIGVEDLLITFIGATLTSSTGSSETWCAQPGGVARAASATPDYYPIGGRLELDATETNVRIAPGFAGVAKNLRCYLSANTYSVDGTLKLFKNGVAVLTTPITLLGGAGWYENAVDTDAFDDNDELSFEIVGGTTGSITVEMIGVTFGPSAAAIGILRHPGMSGMGGGGYPGHPGYSGGM